MTDSVILDGGCKMATSAENLCVVVVTNIG